MIEDDDRDEHDDTALASVFNIDHDDIQGEFIRVPAELAYWSHRYAQAYREAAAAKANEKQVRAAYREVAREKCLGRSGKATLPDIDAALESTQEVIDATEETIEAEYEKVRLFGIIDAIRSKRDMLISVGAQIRAEMQHDPVIKKHGSGNWGKDG